MNQAIHIFRKDVSYLRFDIAITLLAAIALCFLKNPFILPATWWFLIARVIHAEAIPGSRQFWLTRPYEWKSLLGAKLLFILCFVNLPLLIADAVIISWAGFPIVQNVAGLLWTQVLLIAAFVLPAAAVSAITSGMVETLTVTLLLLFEFLLRIFANQQIIDSGASWMELEWVRTYGLVVQIAIAAITILILQYARRNTLISRIMAGATAVVLLFGASLVPWRAAFASQMHLSRKPIDQSSFRITLDTERKWLGRIYASERDQMIAELPLRIGGIPAGMSIKPNGLTIALHYDAETLIANQSPPSSFNFEAGITSLRAAMKREFYEKVRDRSLMIRGTLFFTLYDNKRITPVPLNGRRLPVRGVGICSADPRILICESAFRPLSDSLTIQLLENLNGRSKIKSERFDTVASYSPFPAELNIYPIHRFFSQRFNPISAVNVEASEPLAHAERDFEIDDVRLTDFVVSR